MTGLPVRLTVLAAAAVSLGALPRFAPTGSPGASVEAAGGVLSEFGRVVPEPATGGATDSPDLEGGIAVVSGRLRATFFLRVTRSKAERPVQFASPWRATATVTTLEPAVGVGVSFQPNLQQPWFVRGDVYPFFPLLLVHSGADIEARPANPVGIGFRASAGAVYGPLVLSLTGEFDYWSSSTTVAMFWTGEWWWERSKIAEQEVDFSTRVFRLGVCVGLRSPPLQRL